MVVSQLMDFVNEQDDTFLRVRSEVDDGLDFLFQLSDITGAGYDVAQWKFVDFTAHELIRNGRVVVFQSVGKVFHDFGLAGAGRADQNGVGLVLSDEYAGELLGDGFTEQNGSGGLEAFVVVDEKFIGNGAAVGLHYDRGRNAALIALVAFVVGVGTREVVQAHLGASFPKFCPGRVQVFMREQCAVVDFIDKRVGIKSDTERIGPVFGQVRDGTENQVAFFRMA